MNGIIPARIIQVNYIENLHTSIIRKKDKSNLALTAQVEILGQPSEINIVMLENPKAGDYVIIHEGYALQIIDKEYYEYLKQVYRAKWEQKD
jgi:hydrogenase expression/formation protein HypC